MRARHRGNFRKSWVWRGVAGRMRVLHALVSHQLIAAWRPWALSGWISIVRPGGKEITESYMHMPQTLV